MAAILCTLLVLAMLMIKPIISNLGEKAFFFCRKRRGAHRSGPAAFLFGLLQGALLSQQGVK